MKDPEFIQLRNRFLFGVLIAVVFSVPLFIFVHKTFSNSNILTRINKGETFSILVVTKDCETCELVDDIMDNNNVDYLVLNRYTNKDYDTIMRKMEIVNKRDKYPIIIYVEDGKMKANLFDINGEQIVTEFLTAHKLVNSRD